MYFYWNDGTAAIDYFKGDAVISRTCLLETLNLASNLLLCKPNELLNLAQDTSFSKARDQQTREAGIRLYHGTLQVASEVLSSPFVPCESSLVSFAEYINDSPLNRMKTSIKLASTLLNYSVYLQNALKSTSSDFSALHAICNWFLKTLGNCPGSFIPLLDNVKALHDAISLSTGLGLFVIWSTLYMDDLPQDLCKLINRTNLLSSSLIESADAPGRYPVSYI